MKIAIDTADLDCERIDGTRVYIHNVLKYLGKLSPEDDFFLLHKGKYNKLLKPAKLQNYKNRSLGKGFWWTQIKFARAVRKLKPGVCWMPIQQIPFLQSVKSKVKSRKSIKYVVTIHDLAFKFFGNHFPLIDRLKINFYTDVAVKKADKIIAISEATKKDLIRLYPGINKNKISVVHHGFDRENFQQEFSKDEKEKFLNKWKLTKKNYLLYVGAIQPRKDLITLIRSFNTLKKLQIEAEQTQKDAENDENNKRYKDLKLVLVGEVAWKSEGTIKAVENSEFKDDIIVTGKVDFRELAMFYRWAKIFVFPSLYEGFGIPLLEAMASKTPVITANNSSLGEVGGNAVLKFRSGDKKELAQQIKKILSSKNLQEKMIKRGLKRIEKFSWEKCAKETNHILKSVI